MPELWAHFQAIQEILGRPKFQSEIGTLYVASKLLSFCFTCPINHNNTMEYDLCGTFVNLG